MIREGKASVSAIHPEHGHIVSTLVAAVQELTGRIKVETAGIVTPGPFFGDESEFAIPGDGEEGDTVVQTIARIDEPAIVGNEDFRSKVAARETGWKTGNRLARGEMGGSGVVVEEDDV